jgi:alpha-galactosidase
MRFHRLFVLAAYGSLAIVPIAVLCPTANCQSQHLASTPPMAWNSWNHLSDKVTESDLRAAADSVVASGMRDAGYITLISTTPGRVSGTHKATFIPRG